MMGFTIDARLLAALSLGLLLLLAGCAAGSFGGQEDPATLVLNNSRDQAMTFEVTVVEYPSTAKTVRNDGLTGNYRIGQGLRSHDPGENYTWTDIELPESARLHGRYTLAPGEANRSTIAEFSPDYAVVVVISRDENEIVAWVSAHCGGNLEYVEVAIRDYGSDNAYICE